MVWNVAKYFTRKHALIAKGFYKAALLCKSVPPLMGEVNNLIGRRHPLMMIKKRTPFSYTCCQHMSDDDRFFFLESRTCVNTRPDNT